MSFRLGAQVVEPSSWQSVAISHSRSLVETFRLKVCAAPGVVGGIKGIGGNLTRGEVQRRLLTGGVALRFKVTSDVWMNAMMVNYLAPLLDSRMWDADEQAATSQDPWELVSTLRRDCVGSSHGVACSLARHPSPNPNPLFKSFLHVVRKSFWGIF